MIHENLDSERFLRLERMIGREGLEKLHNSFVTVIGLGAVGSYAVEALARAGVGKLKLVDFDEVRASNINRQLYALTSTIGMAKIEVAKARVLDINPACEVETLRAFVHTDTMESVLAGKPDVIIDGIDSFGPKVELLAAATAREMTVVSSMGAALRRDPTLVRVGPLSAAKNCPLARMVRKRLRQRGASVAFTCVYSIETVADLPETAVGEPQEDSFSRGRKRRTLGSLPTLTGIFGLTAANTTIKILLEKQPEQGTGAT